MPTRLKLAACQRFSPDTPPPGWTVEPIRNRLWLEYGSSLGENDRKPGPYAVYGSNGIVGTHDTPLIEGPGILVGRKGTVGAVHYSAGPFWPIDTVYYVRRLKDDNWRYLYYLLDYLNLGRLNAATGLPGLTRRDAHFILGAFPPQPEQDTISTVLETAEAAIMEAQEKLIAAQRMKKALMQQLFTRGMPGRHKTFAPLTVFRHRVEIPASWDTQHLGKNVIFVEYGTNAASNNEQRGYPVIAIPEVIASRFQLGECSYAEVSESEAQALRLAPGDVLLIRTNGNPEYIGKSTVIGQEAAVRHIIYASYLIRIRTNPEKLSGRYLNYFLASPLGRRQCIATANTSAGNHNLGSRAIRQFLLPRPDPAEQAEIVQLVDAAEDQIDAVAAEVVALDRLKKSLLQNLLTGKVRLREGKTA
jgi:type I restriction enzyme S subunit